MAQSACIVNLIAALTPSQTSPSTPALPVAAIQSLLSLISHSTSKTMRGLVEEIEEACREMERWGREEEEGRKMMSGRSLIPLRSGCELFLRYISRVNVEEEGVSFDDVIAGILSRGEKFAEASLTARGKIAEIASPFIQTNSTILTHGCSRVVLALLAESGKQHKNFNVIVLEGRPDASGVKMASLIRQHVGVPVKIMLDSASGHAVEACDMVICGAEGVVENGGVINKIGTYPLSVLAKCHKKPVYIAAESYKFARLFPLNNGDLERDKNQQICSFVDAPSSSVSKMEIGEGVEVDCPPCDYTPANYITLLFTDLGVLTPSAVSDELIRLYQ